MSRPVGRHRAPRATGFGALRRPAVAATAAISTVSVAGAVYSTTASANAAVAGTAQAKLLIGPPATASSALQAADSGVVADGQAQADAAQQAVSARTAADAKSRSAAAKRATAATKLQHAAAASAKAAKSAAADKADKAAEAKRKAAAEKKAAAKKAAEKKAAAKKAAATKREGASASRSSTRPTASFSGNPQAYASSMLPSYGWNQSQMGCLVSLWNRESGWRANASNPSSGAYGIPQSLPGTKMASAGADWRTNPATQIRWGLGYIKATYGSPCGAWGHSQATGWY